jgi:syntaxin 18
VAEIAEMSAVFSDNVTAQQATLDNIRANYASATVNVQSGNKQLKEAIGYEGGTQQTIVIILFLASFILLFLDWYT